MSAIARKIVFAGMKPKGGNYAHVKRTIRDGIQFDSKKEAMRYDQLRLLERHGDIRNLRLQVPYQLRVNGVLICKYTADFVYEELARFKMRDGAAATVEGVWAEITEDVKGYPNERWPMKKKLFKAIFGKEIRET